VEDDPLTRQILGKIMQRLPVRAALAGNWPQVLEAVQRDAPDLLVLDLMLPDVMGWEVLARVRALLNGRPLRVLILTAKDTTPEKMIAANVAQTDLFLPKPFDNAVLARHVLRLLDLPMPSGWPNPAHLPAGDSSA
jgi:DNA-binding response OmpR family regulator